MGWFGSSAKESQQDDDSSSTTATKWISEYIVISPQTLDALEKATNAVSGLDTTQRAFIGGLCISCFAAGFRAGRVRPVFQRLTSVADIPSSEFLGARAAAAANRNRWLSGRAVSVTDGDTLRFLHAPTIFHSTRIGGDQKVSEQALPIRICTIDTPETAKFGKAGQPFGDDAKQYLSKFLLGKGCQVQLLTKDQYGRAVGQVRRRRFGWFGWWTYADEHMLKAGLAEVYLGSGAVYGHRGKDAYLKLQQKAQNAKKGQWAQKNRESAAEYKARTKS